MATLHTERPLLFRDRRPVLISPEDLRSVCFISADVLSDGKVRQEIIGTMFFLRVANKLYDPVHYYAVTASHVLSSGREPMHFVFLDSDGYQQDERFDPKLFQA